ncbi:DUF2800 domain-containing protein [Clostridium beijerinckii]|uniref:DUF2800 domain-containing protein n=1 Tax=Clostridium beijerinckii TaxID=1520 RepID=UPI00080A57A0|nr:DUF2800 domain-containing protein [Clostridium beijerinckii]OCA97849.1 nuclease [Clostridium beijerinckii]
MSGTIHAILSASSSHRWLHCTPSVSLEQCFEAETSVFAEEGTAAHELSEHKLRKFLKIKSRKPKSEFHCDEMEEYTDVYVNFAIELITKVRQNCKDLIVLIEQRLDFSNYVPEGFGTGDLVIVADKTLYIVDLKYGKGVEVSAEENPQMMLYALGALNLFEALYDIETVNMTIVQPRLESISTYEIEVNELITWAEIELKPKAELAINGEGEFAPGEHCRFCRARATCRARSESFLDLARFEFKMPDLLTDSEIEDVLSLADQLSKWAADIYTYATEKAINEGKEWTGYKLVEGRSNRKYSDETAVVEAVTNAGYKDIYKKTLLGITDMEKLLGKKNFETILGNLIEKPKGKITLVSESDKRKPIKLDNTAKTDFKEEV